MEKGKIGAENEICSGKSYLECVFWFLFGEHCGSG